MTGARPDITDSLVHYIRGANLDEAFDVLRTILSEQCLRCGTGYIRGGHCCVCFSEAPFRYLGYAIAEGYRAERPYQPFGIMVKKDWLFAQGGRPVVYQLENQYTELPDSHRWRHVRYDPCANPPVDFTWEREWRIRVDELPIDPSVAEVVLPSGSFLDMLHYEHAREQDHHEYVYRQIFDRLTAWQMRTGFPWTVHTLAPDGSIA